MKQRLILMLFWALVLHVVVSVVFIVDPLFLRGTRFYYVYKRYVLPGPFFKDSLIVDSYSFTLSWKVKDTWIAPVNPVKENFNRYHATLNPTDLHRSRINRMLQLKLPDPAQPDIKDRKDFPALKKFLFDYYVPKDADSVRMWIINKQAKDFKISKDSLYVAFSR